MPLLQRGVTLQPHVMHLRHGYALGPAQETDNLVQPCTNAWTCKRRDASGHSDMAYGSVGQALLSTPLHGALSQSARGWVVVQRDNANKALSRTHQPKASWHNTTISAGNSFPGMTCTAQRGSPGSRGCCAACRKTHAAAETTADNPILDNYGTLRGNRVDTSL